MPFLSFAGAGAYMCELASPVVFEDGSSIYTVSTQTNKQHHRYVKDVLLKDSSGTYYGYMSSSPPICEGELKLCGGETLALAQVAGYSPRKQSLFSTGNATMSANRKVKLDMKVLSRKSKLSKDCYQSDPDMAAVTVFDKLQVQFKRTYRGKTQKAYGQLNCFDFWTHFWVKECERD